ncbi:Protein kinase-like domain superfamily [Arabidopsis thaliana x Arabidopsis arenosa]|uniref:Wall-associated receptor kinase-like n=1 Tax=Arabidopsis thaliana x Arabidopsis arenosa TaxID=1240361 RepID=A0A8T2BKR3_9BRAS|nr:Protein kinase-like domain superfamily [Arabidopsis thaliana x Arabidopsis arenosa]
MDFADLTVSPCQPDCGGIEIPYPFGIGKGCYLEKWYEVTCNTSTSGKLVPYLSAINKEVVNISLPTTLKSDYDPFPYGSVRIKTLISSKGCSSNGEELGSLLNLTDTPFYVSQRNTLIAVGCNNTASLTNVEPSIVQCKSSCGTSYQTPTKDYLAVLTCNTKYGYDDMYCNQSSIMDEKSCNGIRCCKANLPDRIQQTVGVRIENTTTAGGCTVAFLTDEAYIFSNVSNPHRLHAKRYSTVELGWFIHTEDRSFVKSLALGCYDIKEYLNQTYNQRKNIKINCLCDFNVHLNYTRCACPRGYQGNPYSLGGCTDINECEDKNNYCWEGTRCVNLQGAYDCVSTSHRLLAIGLGTSFGSLTFVGGIYLLYKFIKKQRKLNQKKKFFKRNGGLLLQQQLTSTEGMVEKTKVFSSRELEKATENFSSNRILGQGGQGTVYKGMLVDGRIVAVKKSKVVDEDKLEEFINEVVILSQINHRNIVKLLGCCLETNVPVLVYEYIPNGNLFEHLHDEFDDNMMATWEMRLRIAIDIAGALSYLHSFATSPIYHRDVKSTNIMLDEKYRAKVSDFGTSRTVTVDHTHLTTVVSGTVGYMDPEYFQSSQFTDKSDVYSFGVVLVELITGEKSISFLRSQENRTLATYFILAMKENKLFDIIDARIRDGCMLSQVTATAKVARKCLNLKGRKRPSMREVSMELDHIRMSSGDMQLQEYVSENEEEEEKNKGVVEDTMRVESRSNEVVTAPASQYNIAAASSSSWSDVEPLFPLQTR